MRNRDTIAKAATVATARDLPPTSIQVNALLAKYRPDQERDDHGRFADEGGGGGRGTGGRTGRAATESGWSRAGRYAVNAATVAGAVAGGVALARTRPVVSALRSVGLGGGRAAATASNRPILSAATRRTYDARLNALHTDFEAHSKILTAARREVDAAQNAAERAAATFRTESRFVGPRVGDDMARQAYAAERAAESAKSKLNAALQEDKRLLGQIDELENMLGVKKPRAAKKARGDLRKRAAAAAWPTG